MIKEGWEIKKLGEVVEVLDNLRKPITKGHRIEGEYPYYGATGILSYVHNFIFTEKLILIGEDGAKWLSGDKTSFIVEGKYWVNNHAHVLKFEHRITQTLVENYLNSIRLDDFLTGMAQPKLNKAMLDSIPVCLPGIEEQQTIAECLSSLDSVIAAQTQKLEVLKTHKQGLMQQLFPATAEAADL